MALPRAVACVMLLALLGSPAALTTQPTPGPQQASMSPQVLDPSDPRLAAMVSQGLAGIFHIQGDSVQGTFVSGTRDARGFSNWTVSGDVLLERVDMAGLGGAEGGAPWVNLGSSEQNIVLLDAPHAWLGATHFDGVRATLPAGAGVLRQGADRAVFVAAGRPVLVAGPGLTFEGLEVRAGSLWAMRIEPVEVEVALALPTVLAAWVSPEPGNATLWASPAPRFLNDTGTPPELRLPAEEGGRVAVRVEVGRLADPGQGPVVRRADGTPVPEVSAANLSAFPGLVVNVTSAHPPALWLAHDAAEPLEVTFRLDTQPAQVVRWETLNLTARTALLRALSDEHAIGRLTYWPRDQPSATVAAQTPQPALQMDFPLLALRPATTYAYQLELTDFAGNKALDAVRTFTTPAAPDLPAPVILAVAPGENATVKAPVREIRIAFHNPAGTFDPAQHLRLFVDKAEATEGIAVAGGNITHTPARPLGPGPHTLGVILRNSEGGSVEQEWRFTAEASTPAAPWLWAAGLALGLRLGTARRARAVS